mgnify:CR=1 FL=1
MIEYRKAAVDDIDELVKLRIEFLKEANHEINIDAEILNKCEEALYDYFNSRMIDDSFIAWIALDEGKIIATSGMCFYNTPPLFKKVDGVMHFMDGRVAYIMNMYTLREFRRQGVAKILFNRIVEEAKSLGYRKITLHATEMGRKLYKTFGFVEVDDEMVLNI